MLFGEDFIDVNGMAHGTRVSHLLIWEMGSTLAMILIGLQVRYV